MNSLRGLVCILSMMCIIAFGQDVQPNRVTPTKETATATVTVSGTPVYFVDGNGTISNDFEIVPSGSPSALTVNVYGVGVDGTVTSSALGTSSGTSSQHIPATGPFAKYEVVATFSGGTSPSVKINRLAVTGKNSGGGAADIHGTLTAGNCIDAFSSTLIQDAGSPCAGAAGGTSGQVQVNIAGAFGGLTGLITAGSVTPLLTGVFTQEPINTSTVSPAISVGFPGGSGSCRYLNDYVDQTSSDPIHHWAAYITATAFNNYNNMSYWHGWNIGCGGGKLVSTDSLEAEGWEPTYDPGANITLTLTSVNNNVGGTTTQYNGSITGGAANALVGVVEGISNFSNPLNDGSFVVTASTSSSITVNNPAGQAETHAAIAVGLTAEGQAQDEHHWTHAGINWPFAQVRTLTTANDTLTGHTLFFTWATDVGMLWKFATNDGNLINGCTATMSGATATWTCSGGFPYDYSAGAYFIAGCPVVGVPGCVNFTPSGYNTLWFITGTSGSPGANCGGATTCTATAYSGATGLSAASGGKVYGLGGSYAGISPNVSTGLYTAGNIPIKAGGSIYVNNGSNAGGYGLSFSINSTAGGTAGSNITDIYGSAGSTTTCNNLPFIQASDLSIFLAGSATAPLGRFCPPNSTAVPQDVVAPHILGTFGLAQSTASTGIAVDSVFRPRVCGGFDVPLSYSSDNNESGFTISNNCNGGTTIYVGAYARGSNTGVTNIDLCSNIAGITCTITDGFNVMIAGNGSGLPNFPNGLKLNGSAALTVVTGTGSVVLSASAILTGTPTSPTPAIDNNSTQIATTAYVDRMKLRSISFQFGTPGGSAISTGVLGYVTVPFACSISGWSIQVDAGTATVKTLKVASGTAIPTLGSNSISTSGVAISTGTVIQSTTLTDFTSTTVTANDIMAADLITTSGVGYINFQISCSQ